MSTNDNWLDRQNQQRVDYKNINTNFRKTQFCHLLCTEYVKVISILLIFILTVPPLTYFFIIDEGTIPVPSAETCMVHDMFKVPCGRENLTQEQCWSLMCCFDPKHKDCYHSIPSKYFYVKTDKANLYETLIEKSPFGTKMVHNVSFTVSEKSENEVILKLGVYKEDNSLSFGNDTVDINKNYYVQFQNNELSVEILRKGTNELLLSTFRGPLIVSERYLEWTFYLTGAYLFGVNQNLIRVSDNETFKKVLYKNKLDHYSIPTIWAYSKGKFHSITISHDGPLEITIKPSNLIILRSLTLDNIEVDLNIGHTPKMLHEQLVKQIQVPPYWTMGTHICRAMNTLDIQTIASQFEFDDISTSYCIDEHLIMSIMKDDGKNTSALKSILEDGRKRGKKFFISLSPHVLLDTNLHAEAEKLGILYHYNGTTYTGLYLNEDVVYPDYSSPQIAKFIDQLYSLITQYITVPIDGLLLKDNWPSDEKFHMNGTDFKYFTKELEEAMSFTLPWNSSSFSNSEHIQVHNTYSIAHLKAIKEYLEAKKIDVFLMSSCKNQYYSEPVFMENIDSSWDELRNKLDTVLFESIAGDSLVTMPVCGDTQKFDPLNEILCIRWYFIAATMPMFRVSSVSPWRDPKNLYSTFSKKQALKAVNFRNQLLRYYYTLLRKNEPVIRPMFYDFYHDEKMFSVEDQYMIGKNILVSSPFTPGKKTLHIYLPQEVGIWYEIWGGELYNGTVDPWIIISLVETDIVAFLAQGTILPLMVDNQFNLIVADNCTISCKAEGEVFVEDYIDFYSNSTHLVINNIPPKCDYTLGYIKRYSYHNQTAVTYYYEEKNIPICNGTDSFSVSYQDNLD